MAKTDYIPPQEGPFLNWHDQLKAAMTSIGATLGFTATDFAKVGNDNTVLHQKTAAAAAATSAAKTATTGKLAAQLGIIGADDATDLATAKPMLTGQALPHGVVELGFNKSKADGVNLYAKRGAEADYTFLARDTASPYVDNRALLVAGQPEVRTYKAVYVLDDGEIGLASEPVDITCEP